MGEKILVVSPSWIGDIIMAQTLYKVLCSRFTSSDIDVMAPPSTLSLVSRMEEVSRGIRIDIGHGELRLDTRKRLGKSLESSRYDRAIVLPNSFKSALVPFYADIPIRTGFRGEYRYHLINDMRILDKQALPRMIDRFISLGVDDGDPLPDVENPSLIINEHNREKLKEKFQLKSDRPVLGICPGAEFGDAKKWPEQHFAKLADSAVAHGMQVWIFGSQKDRITAQQIKALMDLSSLEHCIDFSGKTSLLDVIDLLSLCQLVVANDTGLMHVAAAVGCATAVLYGSPSPLFTPPLTDELDILSLELECSPCFKRKCPKKHKKCLNDLHPEMLIPVIEKHGQLPL